MASKSTNTVIAEITAIRQRVEEQYPAVDRTSPLPLLDLLPLFHARDAAEGKVAAIGKVNPRPPGIANAGIQTVKRTLARGLNWLIRDQVEFNAATVRALTETIEAFNSLNRSLLAAGKRMDSLESSMEEARREADAHLREATDSLSTQIRVSSQNADGALRAAEDQIREEQRAAIAQTGTEFRQLVLHLEQTLTQAVTDHQRIAASRAAERDREDIRLLRTLADVQNAFQQRMAELEAKLQEAASQQAEMATSRAVGIAREEIVRGLSRVEAQLHSELRTMRQRVGAILSAETRNTDAEARSGPNAMDAARAIAAPEAYFDSLRFADRFRGPEERVREDLRVHLPVLAAHGPVLDLGCGRGEFLELLREAGVDATGVDANPELVRLVTSKGLRAVEADLFRYLEAQPDGSAGAIFCAHVIEHLTTQQLARLISLAERVLRPQGALVFETPNPQCLAIFATYFYLDPTHLRPVPSELVRYLLEEAGFQSIQVTGLHAAEGDFHELKPLPDGFRQQFFGFMDYAVVARKP